MILRRCLLFRGRIGMLGHDLFLYGDLTARENLTFWGKMYGLRGSALKSRVNEVLDVIGLTDRAGDRVGKYSGGMKRRVNIGVALLHKPKVIYMDEPTVGIDPQSRRSILDSVVALKNQGMTVLYTTHYMEESQELSDHIAIMDHGRLITCCTHDELVKLVGQQTRNPVVQEFPRGDNRYHEIGDPRFVARRTFSAGLERRDQLPRHDTIAARECDDYTDIRANLARNDIQESLEDLGADTLYEPGEPIDPRTEHELSRRPALDEPFSALDRDLLAELRPAQALAEPVSA